MPTSDYAQIFIIIVVSVLALGTVSSTGQTTAVSPEQTSNAAAEAAEAGYNFVIILTDDQRWDTVQYMPFVNKFFSENGVNFTNTFAVTPLCCPSRASILKGLYPHNMSVTTNYDIRSFDDKMTIAKILHDAGYRTGLYGKYLNGYNQNSFREWPYIPPGWDEWHVFKEGDIGRYYNYILVENGAEKYYDRNPENYSTTLLAKMSVKFIETAPPDKPLFLYYAPYAPHSPAFLAEEDKGKFKGFPMPKPPSFNEDNVTDKPLWVRKLPNITRQEQKSLELFYRKQLASLQAVDRGAEMIVDALDRTGRLDNTVIIFMSDNGYAFGEHRWKNNKRCVYEECIRIPMMVYVPGTEPREEGKIALNVDIAPTIADMAGVAMPYKPDGMNLAPLLEDPSVPWRTEVLLEFLPRTHDRTGLEGRYQAVRTERYVYVEYGNGDREFYDLEKDPYELENIYYNQENAGLIRNLTKLLNTLRGRSLVKQPQASIMFEGNDNNLSPNATHWKNRTVVFNITASERLNFDATNILNATGKKVATFNPVKNTTSILLRWDGKCAPAYCSGTVPAGAYNVEITMTPNVNQTNMSTPIIVEV